MFLIPIIAILAFFLYYQHRNKQRFGAISFLIGLYLVMGLCAIVLYFFGGYDSFDVRLEPMAFLTLCLCIMFWGFLPYSDTHSRVLVIENTAVVRWLELFQIITSIAAIGYFLPLVRDALSGNIADNRGDLDYLQHEVLASFGFMNSFFSLVGNLFGLSMILAFVNFATLGRGGTRLRATLLLVLSTVYVFYVLAYVGRDGFVYWTFTFVFVYLMFRDLVSAPERKRIARLALAVFFPSMLIFLLITVARFSETTQSVLMSLFEYAGSQIFSFNDHYVADTPPMMGLVNFEQFLQLGALLSDSEKPQFNRLEWFAYFTGYGAMPWTFSTFVGSFLHDFGKGGTLALTLAISMCVRLLLRRQAGTGTISLSRLLLFFVFSQVVLYGVFYYRQFSAGYYLIAMALISAVLRASFDSGRTLSLARAARGA